jgi:GntR family transcriptional regulator
VPLSRQTAYDQVAAALRAAILAGDYEPTQQHPDRDQLPGAAELGGVYGVSDKTAARAVQQLVAEGLVRGRPGRRAVVVGRLARADALAFSRPYACATSAGGMLVGDTPAGEAGEHVTASEPRRAPASIAALLGIPAGDPVWVRERETVVDGRVAVLGASWFPREVAERASLTAPGPLPPGGSVQALQRAGHPVVRARTEVRARLATDDELRAFGPERGLRPLTARIVVEITRVRLGERDQPLEAVVTVRPAADTVIGFETQEAPGDVATPPASPPRPSGGVPRRRRA